MPGQKDKKKGKSQDAPNHCLDGTARNKPDSEADFLNSHQGLTDSASGEFYSPKPANLEGSLYPHAQLPLMPKILLPFLQNHCIRTSSGQTLQVDELQHIWPSQLAAQDAAMVFRQIAELVQATLYSRKCMQKMQLFAIEVPNGLRLSELVLSKRARAALQSREFFCPHGPWRHCTLKDLAATQSLGAKLLLAFLLALEHGAQSQESLKNQTESCTSARAQPTHLEDDLRDLTDDALYNPRCAEIFLLANGWGGQPVQRLELISAQHNISKERARQVLALASAAMSRYLLGTSAPPRLMEALALLEKNAPMTTLEAGQALNAAGLSRISFEPIGVLRAAHLFGIPTKLGVSGESGVGTGQPEALVCTASQCAQITALQGLAASMARSLGLISEQWLIDRALKTFADLELTHVRLALQTDPRLQALVVDADQRQWFWLGESSKPGRVAVRALKLISFFGRATLDCMSFELNGRVATAELKTQGKIGKEVLAALLTQCGMASDPSGVWSAKGPSALATLALALPAKEAQMAHIVRRTAGVMSKECFYQAARQEQLNVHTAQAYLRRSPLFCRGKNSSNGVFLIDPNGANNSINSVS